MFTPYDYQTSAANGNNYGQRQVNLSSSFNSQASYTPYGPTGGVSNGNADRRGVNNGAANVIDNHGTGIGRNTLKTNASLIMQRENN